MHSTKLGFYLLGSYQPEDGAENEHIYEYEEDWVGDKAISIIDENDDASNVYFDVLHFKSGWEENAQDIIKKQTGTMRNDYNLEQYESRAASNWDVFYKRNTTNFFKDRHYLLKAFPVLELALSKSTCTIIEIGCGVGNTIVPLTTDFQNCYGYGVDFANSAIELLNDKKLPRCHGFVYDVSKPERLPECIPQAHVATMIYVLSAISPENMQQAILNVIERLKPGGVLCFRDYGFLDQAQVRFSADQRLGLNYYVRQDGTRSFFFTLEGMKWLFEIECGLEIIECRYIKRVVMNRKNDMRMRRVFVNAMYRKPL